MNKTLRVTMPFFVMEVGDLLQLNEDGTAYSAQKNEKFHSDSNFESSYESKFTISADYAKELIEDGFLEVVTESKPFVNIFDEIDNLLNTYQGDLESVNNDAESPECIKLEKRTVLANMIKLLTHLKELRK